MRSSSFQTLARIDMPSPSSESSGIPRVRTRRRRRLRLSEMSEDEVGFDDRLRILRNAERCDGSAMAYDGHSI